MSSTPSDPFHPAHNDLLSRLSSTGQLLSSYRRIIQTSSSKDSPEARESRAELSDSLSDLAADLQDLTDSVAAAEQDPSRYSLSPQDVRDRKSMVRSVSSRIERLQREVDATLKGKTGTSGGSLPDPAAFDEGYRDEEDNDAYAELEQQRQEELWADQDEALEGVGQTVGNLRLQASEMGRELEEQEEMLGEVDNLADRVGGKLKTGMKRIEYVVKKNEGECTLLARSIIMQLCTDHLKRQVLKLLHWRTDICFDPLAHSGPRTLIEYGSIMSRHPS